MVGRELRFLESTAQAVARRTPESLEPITGEAVPDEIQPLVAALNGLLARLGHALTQQRHFIADAAHELRTPLTALRLQLQLAERAHDSAERDKAHAMLREGIARATRVVEQLLTLARQDPDAPVEGSAPVDLAELAKSVAHAQEPAAAARGLSLGVEASGPAVVAGDRDGLRAMLENLVDNAIRYTPSGHVTVRVGPAGDEARLEVEDTGPGIPAAERARVFDRFYRGEAVAAGGSGLGLAIVRRIAERHRGRVELLDPVTGRGLRVRVTLPAKR
jgi:two-component system OmpR family sensor kinase